MAAAAGLDLDQVGRALVERPGGVISQMAWSSLLTPPEPINFSAEWAAKDLSYARRMNGEAHRPILDAVLSLFSRDRRGARPGRLEHRLPARSSRTFCRRT